MGIPPDEFSSHSFHIGAATSAAISGVMVSEIKGGSWKPSAFQLYIGPHKIYLALKKIKIKNKKINTKKKALAQS